MTSLTPLATESQAWLILSGICGILLLLVGGAVIRLGVVLTGLVIGTLAGWMIWAGLEVPVPSWLMMILGAIVCICLALLLSRFVTALLLGIVLATWLITLVLTWSVFDPKLESPVQPVSTWMALTLSLHQNPDQQPPIDENDAAHAGIVMHQSITTSWDQAQETWSSLPEIYHLILGIAAAAGLVFGCLTGLFFPRSGLMMMTCGWGGLLLLTSGIGLLGGGGHNDGPWQSSIAMLIAWTALSAVGWAVQCGLHVRDRDDQT